MADNFSTQSTILRRSPPDGGQLIQLFPVGLLEIPLYEQFYFNSSLLAPLGGGDYGVMDYPEGH